MKNLVVLAVLFIAINVSAQDRVFSYTYQSNVLNGGQKELEIWSTLGTARENYYRGFNHSLEFELGLGHKLQTAFYLNYGYSKGISESNGTDLLSSATSFSFANEWKLKLSDPVADKIGSALYLEYALAPDAADLEGKIILDKQSGHYIQALNLTGELGFEKEFMALGNKIKVENANELKLELNYGWSYKLSNNWFAGFEIMNENVLRDSKLEKSLLTAGPGFSYSNNGYWINFSLMPQITELKSGSRNIADEDGLQARLIFSYEF